MSVDNMENEIDCNENKPLLDGRSARIQMIRGLAIISVIVIHTWPSGLPAAFYRPFVNCGVPLFLFLSGYLTDRQRSNIRDLVVRRIRRVLIPYFIWVSFYSLSYGKCNLNGWIFNLVTGTAGPQFYFILVYIQLVLLTPILLRVIQSKYKSCIWILSPLSILIFVYLPLLCGFRYGRLIEIFWSDSCLGWIIYYYEGLLLRNSDLDFSYSNKRLVISLIAAVLLQIIEGLLFYYAGDINCGTQLKLSSLFTSVIIIVFAYRFIHREYSYKKDLISKTLVLIGNASFGIYLIHIIVIYYLNVLFLRYSETPFYIQSLFILVISCSFVYLGRRLVGARIGRWLGFY